MGKLLFTLIILAVFVFIAYQIFTFLFAVNNTKSQRKRDVGKLKAELQPLIDGLVKLDDDELELLSINTDNVKTIPSLNPITKGVFTSIYHEPLIAFGQKRYAGSDEKLTSLHTSSHDFVYSTKGNKTTVTVDQHLLGTVHSDGNLYDMKDRLIAHIAADDILQTHAVKVGSREVGEVINPMLASSPNPRAYTFLEPMDSDEKVLFMALTLLSLVEETL